MNDPKHDFSHRLLAAETARPTERYQQEMKKLLAQPLTPVRRAALVISAIVGFAQAGLLGFIAVQSASSLPATARVAIGVGAIGGVIWSGFSLGILWRGHLRRLRDPVLLNNTLFIVSVFATALGAPLALSLPDRAQGTQVLLTLLLFPAMTSLFLIRTLIEQAELRTREKLLELQLQVQELAEQLRQEANAKP